MSHPPLRFPSCQTWKSLPDTNEISKDLPSSIISDPEALQRRLAASNVFFVAKRVLKDTSQLVFYLSLKLAPAIPVLLELTFLPNTMGVKAAIKTPSPEWGPLLFDALESLLK